MLSRKLSRLVLLLAACLSGAASSAASPASAPAAPTTEAAVQAKVSEMLSRLDPIQQFWMDWWRLEVSSTEARAESALPEERETMAKWRDAQRAWYAFMLEVKAGKQKLTDPAVKERAERLARQVVETQQAAEAVPQQRADAFWAAQVQLIKQMAAGAKTPAYKAAVEEQVRLMEEEGDLVRRLRVEPASAKALQLRIYQLQTQRKRVVRKVGTLAEIEMLQAQLAKEATPEAAEALKKKIEISEQIAKACDALSAAEERYEELVRQREALDKKQ